MIPLIDAGDARALERFLARPTAPDRTRTRRVSAIVADVERRGDVAVRAYANRFDQLESALEVTPSEINAGARATPASVRRAIRMAARHIRCIARAQRPRSRRITVVPGVSIEQRVVPLSRVGCYVPGGRYPLPSSLLMTAIPARIAGVSEIVAVCARPEPAVLCAAAEAGVDRLFRVGGAHAIAAMAFGTQTIPRVDKIVGPGNAYVAAAKALVAPFCAIDFHAGPTEIVIVASEGRADWVAADLLAQAEHDVEARAILITTSRRFGQRVQAALLSQLQTSGPAAQALARHGAIIVTRSRRQSIAIASAIAPEHLACDDETVASAVPAGAVFVGRWTAQALGDYTTGSNHVLPTGGAARTRGGLSAADFVRVVSVQRVTRRGVRAIGGAAVTLAEAEGLTAHARSVAVRLSS